MEKIRVKLIPKALDGTKIPDKYKDFKDYYRTFDSEFKTWAKQHPTIQLNGVTVNTSDLKDYIYDLAMYESSFDPKKSNGSHYGYFQIKDYKGNKPFDALVEHLNNSLARVTVEDLSKAHARKLSDAAVLAKLHNRGDELINWLWGSPDSTDGTKVTKISEYGNDWAPNTSILDKIITKEALKPNSRVIAKSGDSFETYAPLVRYPGMKMSEIPLLMEGVYKQHYDRKKPWVGDYIYTPVVEAATPPNLREPLVMPFYKHGCKLINKL